MHLSSELIRLGSRGHLTWVLGPGVNDGPDAAPPTADALRRRLAETGGFRSERTHAGLIDVAEDVARTLGPAVLHDVLTTALTGHFTPTPLHRFLARVPSLVRARGGPPSPLLIVDLNLDRTLEQAFDAGHEAYDVVVYQASGRHRGLFMHHPWSDPEGSEPRIIERPNEYPGLRLAERTVILKFYGAVDESDPSDSSFVVTETEFDTYLSSRGPWQNLPVTLAAHLRRSRFLFAGLPVDAWHLRTTVRRLVDLSGRRRSSWAVSPFAEREEKRFWERCDIELLSSSLESFLVTLEERWAA